MGLPLEQQPDELRDRYQLELQFQREHEADDDAALLAYVRSVADALGHRPSQKETVGYYYLRQRLGNWPKILTAAGLCPQREPEQRKRIRALRRQRQERQLREKRMRQMQPRKPAGRGGEDGTAS